ncbi:MAG TPA: hypothetical protein VH391_10170 [Solirubrobacterales bacterium]|jgi:hypothetical protein
MQKPQRTILNRVSAYADEAAGFLRRRRITRKPFARVYLSGGRTASFSAESAEGRRLFAAAADLIDVARATGEGPS